MNMPEPDSRLEAWERWERPAIAALPYVMLTITTGIGLIIYTGSEGTLLIDLGLVGLAAGLLVTCTLWHAVRERPAFMAVYFTAMIMVMALLVIRSPWFGFFTFTGYFYAYYIPVGEWRLLAVAAVALVTATSQDGGLPRHTPAAIAIWAVIVCISLLVAESLTWFGWVSSEQNDRRKLLVTELSEANRKLTASLEENVGLHVQLLAQAREAGVLDERQRMAREIHDTLAQGLTGIITQLEAAGQAGKSAEQWRHHSTPRSGWRGRACRKPGDRCTPYSRSRWRWRGYPMLWPRSPSAGRPAAALPLRSPRREVPGGCVRRSRSRCSGPRRRRWPTWLSTPARAGSG